MHPIRLPFILTFLLGINTAWSQPKVAVKFAQPRYVALEGKSPALDLVLDGDLTKGGNQPLADGLQSFAIRLEFTPNTFLNPSASQITFPDQLKGTEVIIGSGFVSIRAKIPNGSAPYEGTALAHIALDEVPNGDQELQFTLAPDSLALIDGSDEDQASTTELRQMTFHSVSTDTLNAEVRLNQDTLLPELTFDRRPGWDYFVEASDDPSQPENWLNILTQTYTLDGALQTAVLPSNNGFVIDSLATPNTPRRFYRVRIDPLASLPFFDFEVPESLTMAEYLNQQMDAYAPAIPTEGDKQIFAAYSSSGQSDWADNWTEDLDFSGVAWDDNRAGTLISEQYIAYSRHFARPDGSTVRFTDRDGDLVERTITNQDFPWFEAFALKTDIQIARLNEPVPPSVTTYPLFPCHIDHQELTGAKLLLTHQLRGLGMAKISSFVLFEYDDDNDEDTPRLPDHEIVTAQPDGSLINPAWAHRVIRGDSGHPNFFIIEGQLVLVSHHTFTGNNAKGPYYGGQGNHLKVQRLMDEL